MKSIFFISLALSIFDQPFRNDQNWISYKEKFGKTYLNKYEEVKRYNIYKEKDELITAHNEKFLNGEVEYEMGHNQFSDMSDQELEEYYLSSMPTESESSEEELDEDTELNEDYFDTSSEEDEDFEQYMTNTSMPGLRDSVSYLKYCLPPLNQGKCSSCWVFAPAAQVEVQLNIKRKFKRQLSPQYLLDCSGGGDCKGGHTIDSLNFMKDKGGVLLDDYPLRVVKQRCNTRAKRYKLGIKKTNKIKIAGDENQLKNAIKAHGPIVVSYKVVPSFFSYKSGIYSDRSCPNDCALTSHAMVLIGYGPNYWLVKNSWGTDWGYSGYGKIKRNVNCCNIGCKIQYALF